MDPAGRRTTEQRRLRSKDMDFAAQTPVAAVAAQSAVVTLLAGGAGMLVMLALPALLPSVFSDVAPILVLLCALTIPLSLHTQFVAGLQNLIGQVTLQF